MKQTVYIETTIPSDYHNDRPSLDVDANRTRTWWDDERTFYECFTSQITLDELSEGDYPTKAKCLDLTRPLPLLEINDEILEIAEVYWTHPTHAPAPSPQLVTPAQLQLPEETP